jgi:hypothetical protein
VLAIVQNDCTPTKTANSKPEAGFTLLSYLIDERMKKFKSQEPLESLN